MIRLFCDRNRSDGFETHRYIFDNNLPEYFYLNLNPTPNCQTWFW